MMRSAKIRLDNVTREMYKDLRETINQGLRNYRAARVEWIRACSVIEEYNEVSKFVATTRNSESSKEKFLKIIQNEIDAAEKRLNVSQYISIYDFSLFYTQIDNKLL